MTTALIILLVLNTLGVLSLTLITIDIRWILNDFRRELRPATHEIRNINTNIKTIAKAANVELKGNDQ